MRRAAFGSVRDRVTRAQRARSGDPRTARITQRGAAALGAGLPTSPKRPTEGLQARGQSSLVILETFGRECAGSGGAQRCTTRAQRINNGSCARPDELIADGRLGQTDECRAYIGIGTMWIVGDGIL